MSPEPVAMFNLFPAPLLEWSTGNGVDQVCNVLPRELFDLLVNGRQRLHCRTVVVLAGPIEQLLDLQSLEMRQLNHLDIIAMNSPPLVGTEVTKVPDRHRVVGAQIYFDI